MRVVAARGMGRDISRIFLSCVLVHRIISSGFVYQSVRLHCTSIISNARAGSVEACIFAVIAAADESTANLLEAA